MCHFTKWTTEEEMVEQQVNRTEAEQLALLQASQSKTAEGCCRIIVVASFDADSHRRPLSKVLDISQRSLREIYANIFFWPVVLVVSSEACHYQKDITTALAAGNHCARSVKGAFYGAYISSDAKCECTIPKEGYIKRDFIKYSQTLI